MADKKISALPAATTPLTGTEVLPVVQGGVTDQVSVANLTAGRDVAVKKLNPTDNVVMAAGKGIDFSANANAPGMTSELLNWYETGTWTPTQGTFTTWTTPVFIARYTRIGNQVTLFLQQRQGTIASGGAGKKIGGLPFEPAVSGSGVATNGSVQSVSDLLVYPGSELFFVSDTGSQTSLAFTISYTV